MLEKTDFQNIIGSRIKELRVRENCSQRQLALKANKDPQSLERVENGKSCPTIYSLVEISEALDINLSEFFKGIVLK